MTFNLGSHPSLVQFPDGSPRPRPTWRPGARGKHTPRLSGPNLDVGPPPAPEGLPPIRAAPPPPRLAGSTPLAVAPSPATGNVDERPGSRPPCRAGLASALRSRPARSPAPR